MAYSPKELKKVKNKTKRNLNPNVRSDKLTRLKRTNPYAYKLKRKKEADRSVASGHTGLKPRSPIAKKGPMKARTKPKSKLMSAKRYIGAKSRNPATNKVKKRVVTSGLLHQSGKGGTLSSYAKKVKSHTKRKTAGPNAIARTSYGKLGGAKPKFGAAWRKGEGTQTAHTPIIERAVRKYSRKNTANYAAKKKTNNKRSPGSKSRSFRKSLGGY